MSQIALSYHVKGTPLTTTFPVRIDKNLTVGDLKGAIKAEGAPALDSWAAGALRR